ncbi:Mu transposase C-terminal domain-containing protein [Kordiimonas gwangyangensis]|uniref:Mu transposase C-terminal domain-containing protein n=1 Tax=Kordiimonas gwangyangensis TaxID=288022 RepID=UPI000369823A|nr:Mu transposase C-terminal domain-containing protein [Kordiimonas gwangyangensis]
MSSVEKIPTRVLERAYRVYLSIQELYAKPTVSKGLAAAVGLGLGYDKRTIYRKLSQFRPDMSVEHFLPRKYQAICHKRQGRVPQETEEIIRDYLLRYYIERPEDLSLTEILMLINKACREKNTSEISLSTLYRRLNDLPQSEKNATRRDKSGAKRQKMLPGKLVTRTPLEHIQIDHTMVDMMCDLREFGLGIRRPWLTLAIDVATRCIYGYYLSLTKPNVEACALTILMGCTPKKIVLERLGISLEPFVEKGIVDPWPLYGGARFVRFDNAREFLSPRFQRGLMYLGMKGIPRPIGSPHYGGHIERVIGRFMANVHMLPGTTFSNVVQRKDYPAEKKAVMSIDAFETWIALNILRYHMTVHHELGCSPYDQFCRLKENIVSVPKHDLRLQAQRAFLKRDKRDVRPAGIVLKHRWYHCDRLAPYLGQKVLVGWQDNDLSRIFVSLDGTFDHLEVPLAPYETSCRYWEVWNQTRARKGRPHEDQRQTELAADLLEAQLALPDLNGGQQAQREERLQPQAERSSARPYTASPLPRDSRHVRPAIIFHRS